VLLIEADAALRRVIALGLRKRGVRVVEARSLGEAWDLARTPPAAVVLDIGLGPNSEWMMLRTVRAHRVLGRAPLILLAWDCPIDAALGAEDSAPRICLTKPFDARALYASVERVLAAAPAREAALAQAASVTVPSLPEVVAAQYSTELAPEGAGAKPHGSAPSAWPLVTAAGAALAVVGLLIHIAVMIVGVVIIFAAVLLWSGDAGEPATTTR
jgi:CheY-like chemotaxis protein